MATESPELSGVVDGLLMLLQESADYHCQRPEIKKVLEQALLTLIAIHRRLHVGERRYVVAAVGLSNVGKSTLLNALLGSDLAPRRNGPCTAAPIEFRYGDQLQVTAYLSEHYSRPTWHCEDVSSVQDRLAQLADDGGAEASRRIRKIEVEIPHGLLANGLVIADTPGFGAAQTAEAAGSHEESLKQYLQQDVSQVFWIVLGEQGIGRREKQFHEQFFADICDDIVVTGCEEWDDRDKVRFRRRFAELLGTRPRFHFVSGKLGAEARGSADMKKLEEAGITLLESRVRELAEPAGRTEAIRDALMALAQDIGFWLQEYRDQRGLPLSRRWRPDSWDRFNEPDAAQGLRSMITASLGP